MIAPLKLETKEIRKKWYVVAGVSRLGGPFKTEEIATQSMNDERKTYEYWMNSAGVIIENTPAVFKHLS